jgi:dynein heavy chain
VYVENKNKIMQNMINDMMREINDDYYTSVKKSILDYVLKDETEKMRIGIMEIFNPVVDYGDNIYK